MQTDRPSTGLESALGETVTIHEPSYTAMCISRSTEKKKSQKDHCAIPWSRPESACARDMVHRDV